MQYLLRLDQVDEGKYWAGLLAYLATGLLLQSLLDASLLRTEAARAALPLLLLAAGLIVCSWKNAFDAPWRLRVLWVMGGVLLYLGITLPVAVWLLQRWARLQSDNPYWIALWKTMMSCFAGFIPLGFALRSSRLVMVKGALTKKDPRAVRG